MKSEKFVAPYLRSLIAAEGGVGLDKSGRINHLLIGTTKDLDKKFYKECLEILRIKSKEYEQRVEIWEKF